MNRLEKIKILLSKRNTRIAYCRRDIKAFALYYFPHLFGYPFATFHDDMFAAIASDDNIFADGFRESGKTLIFASINTIHKIAYRHVRFGMFYSFEETLSSAKLFDIVNQLMTNDRLIADFGELFPRSTKQEDGLQKRSVHEFITTNGIKFQSMSLGKTPRGAVFITKDGAFRPDYLVLDDLDTMASVRNPEIVKKNFDFIRNEIFGGVADNAKIVVLGNTIAQDGIIPRLRGSLEGNPRWKLFNIPVRDKDGKIVWDRYVETDLEAAQWNVDRPRRFHKISLESKLRDQGEEAFKANFLLIPTVKNGAPVFDLGKLGDLQPIDYKQDTQHPELRIFKKLDTPRYDLIIGVDTSGGSPDGDFAVIRVRDRNLSLYASYRARIKPDLLVNVIVRLWDLGYRGVIGIESNNTGIATINKARENTRIVGYLYLERSVDKTTSRTSRKYGWNTNAKTKPLMISEMDEFIRNGSLKEFDDISLDECKSYYYTDDGGTESLSGKHDDTVMADAICVQMRKYTVTTFTN